MAQWQPPVPTDEQKELYFPAEIPPPAAGVFELGLVMSGTVSAGAYTAGVLDFLFEALDAWSQARENAPDDVTLPSWQTVLKVIGGASGGGVNAATVARAVPYIFPHVHNKAEGDSKDGSANPFYDLWVNQLDIRGMLDTGDLVKGQPVPSLLNTAPIDDGARSMAGYVGTLLQNAGSLGPKKRTWLPDTLSVFLTLTNMRGMPYSISFGQANFPLYYVDHADYARLEVDTRPDNTTPVRPDAFGVSTWRPTAAGMVNWDTVTAYGIATGAFPVGFRPRNLERPTSQYAWRISVLPDGKGGASSVRWLTPDWDSLAATYQDGILTGSYNFPVVDGGGTDNVPVELVRTALAGAIGSNPRSSTEACRAVVVIDPFTDPAPMGPQNVNGMLASLAPLAQSLLGQVRYDSSDLMLAGDPDVFSRFMLTATRSDGSINYTGSRAIASGGLGAFQGFLSASFRQHDFLLGRYNAWYFLKEQLVLSQDNPLFGQWREKVASRPDGKQILARYLFDDHGKPCLPLIPLLGSAAAKPVKPAWPANTFDPKSLGSPLKKRIKAFLPLLESETLDPDLALRVTLDVINAIADDKLEDKIMTAITASLKDWKLL